AWILSRLGEVSRRFDVLCEEYRFSDAFGLLYNFAWSEVFDWYLEMTKTALVGPTGAGTRQTLGVVMRDLLKLFHPVIPYLTEELWQYRVADGFLAAADESEVPEFQCPQFMTDLQGLIAAVRCFWTEQGLRPRRELTVEMF